MALAGAVGGFAEAAEEVPPKLSGLRVSESTVERTTERVGEAVGRRLGAGQTFGATSRRPWSKDAEGKSVASVSADATGVGTPGANGSAADGRMASVGMVWNAGEPGQVRYACGPAAAQEAHRVLLVYFTNQVHRMDYPAYRAKGWLIGSGPVEAACKPVVGQRMKGTGMRRGKAGADAICHLRALFRSEKGQWDAFFAPLAA